ncbi:MAG: glycosyltransferase family 1 protein [Aggregatilineales bacterium]
MRIGFDVSQTGKNKAGCGYFADSLIRHLADLDPNNEYILYPTFGDFFFDPDWPKSTRMIRRPNFKRGLAHRTFEAAQFFWSNPPQQAEAMLGAPDIIHANNFYCPVWLKNTRLIYTLYDLIFIEHPEWTTEANRSGCFDGVFNASLRADYIVSISEYSRAHFLETFPHYPEEKVVTVYPASRFAGKPAVPSRPDGLPPLETGGFWLNVATLEPRKNHERLLRAYARLKQHRGSTFPLVLVGARGWLIEGFRKQIAELGLEQDVLMPGYIDDTALQWLYQNCFAFVYPSLFEGFGLPVLEAMSLGAPVISSNTSSLPEIVGSAGLLVDPLDVDSIFEAMLLLTEDEQTRIALKECALERANEFSWEHTARQILKLYESLAA